MPNVFGLHAAGNVTGIVANYCNSLRRYVNIRCSMIRTVADDAVVLERTQTCLAPASCPRLHCHRGEPVPAASLARWLPLLLCSQSGFFILSAAADFG